MAGGTHSETPATESNAAAKLHGIARGLLWAIAFGIMVVIPWAFGGNGPEGYVWIMWSGRLCALPLALWAVACTLRRERPGAEFWVPVICWGLLAVQVLMSLHNPSHVTEPPWVGDGFTPIPHNESLPSTTFPGSTIYDGNLWLAFGLLALSAKCIGLRRRPLRLLLWCFVVNTTVLALVGIPFKFSGQPLILGKWQFQEMYFYSTFLYHNHWCAFALLALGAATGLCASAEKNAARAALIFMGIVIAASAPISTSRLGTLAILGFGLVVAVSLLRKKFSPEGKQIRLSPVLILGAVLGLAAMAAGTAYFYKSRAMNQGDRSWGAILHSNPFGLRQTFVEDTIPMLKKKPIFGWGLGGFGAAFRFYQRAETRIVHNEGRITLYDHIHDDWLERWAELGIVGFGLFLAPGIYWFIKALRRRPSPPLDHWLLVGCIGLLIFAFGDMAFTNNAVAASFALLFALCTGNRGYDK